MVQTDQKNALLRALPKVDDVLHDAKLARYAERLPHELVLAAARHAVGQTRADVLAGRDVQVDAASVARMAARSLEAYLVPSLRRVINASGVIVHTNLGRSVLAEEAIQAVNEVIRGYSTLEYDIDNMARGSRHAHCEKLLCALTGAEAAIAVNNNAAAVMMVLSEFAAGHEAIVSRGELIEIGGSFRIPDIMQQSHATPETAMYLKVHPSNYRLIGFTENVGVDKLHELAARANEARPEGSRVLVYEDQGSGAFARLSSFGSYAEPTVSESLAAGADLVSFSGDKLLGDPQAGIIVGSKELIDRLKKNPLARALRLDKMTLAALEATLRLYLDPKAAIEKIPTLRMLEEPAERTKERAEKLERSLAGYISADDARLSVVPEIARAGGGALPMCDIDTYCVKVDFVRGDALGCTRYLEQEFPTPIITRLKNDAVYCDCRSVLDELEVELIAQAFNAYFEGLGE